MDLTVEQVDNLIKGGLIKRFSLSDDRTHWILEIEGQHNESEIYRLTFTPLLRQHINAFQIGYSAEVNMNITKEQRR